MNEDSFKAQKIKAVEFCLFGSIEVEFLNHDYKLKLPITSLVNRKNNYFEIGELVSNKKVFKFRWDKKTEKIDVDLFDLGLKISPKDFISHWTKKISDTPNRKYQFGIEYKEELIFKAIAGVRVKTENRMEKSLRYCIKGETGQKA